MRELFTISVYSRSKHPEIICLARWLYEENSGLNVQSKQARVIKRLFTGAEEIFIFYQWKTKIYYNYYQCARITWKYKIRHHDNKLYAEIVSEKNQIAIWSFKHAPKWWHCVYRWWKNKKFIHYRFNKWRSGVS